PEHRSLQRRIKQLLSQHGKTWRGPLTATQGGRFERGLLYLDLPAAMLDRPRGAGLAEHPALAWLAQLNPGRGPGEAAFIQPASHPLLARAGALAASPSPLSARAALALAESPQAAGLHTLDVNYNHIGDEGIAALVNSPHLAGLRHLHAWIC